MYPVKHRILSLLALVPLRRTFNIATNVSTWFLSASITILLIAGINMSLDVVGLERLRILNTTMSHTAFTAAVFALVIFCVKVTVSLWSEVVSIGLAILTCFLLFPRTLGNSGHPLAALFLSEDNAAWVKTLSNQIMNPDSTGYFGPVVDYLLSSSYSATSIIHSASFADRLAMSVLAIHLLVVLAIPFITAAITAQAAGQPSSSHMNLGTGILITSGFLFFSREGHLATAIALVMSSFVVLDLYLTRLNRGKLTLKHVLVLTITNVMIAATWFPAAVIAIGLICITAYYHEHQSRLRSLFCLTAVVVAISVIVMKELIPRGRYFQGDGSGIVSGFVSLLTMGGGLGSLGFISPPIVLMLLLLSAVSIVTHKRQLDSLLPITVCWTVVVLIQLTNSAASSGEINYGAEKVEQFVSLITLVFSYSLLIATFRETSEWIIRTLVALITLSMLIHMPSFAAFMGRSYYQGLADTRALSIAVSLSQSIAPGELSLCMYDTFPADSEAHHYTYLCSRWAVSLSNTDSETANEWRKAVLGQLNPDDFRRVRDDLGESARVFRVPPLNADKSDHIDWQLLVNERWDIEPIG